MRPAGDVHLALIQACEKLYVESGRGLTMRELAGAASVGFDAATNTLKNLRRMGVLARIGEQAVGYRNRPVALWAPARAVSANDDSIGLATAMRVWG